MTTPLQVQVQAYEDSLSPGLSAAIADPLWLLSRQWQVGELTAEDAATPVMASFTLQSIPVAAFAPSATPSSGTPLPAIPLACAVEAEASWTGPAARRLSAEMGLLALRALEEKSLSADGARLLGAASLRISLAGVEPEALPVMSLLARRSFDGYALYHALAAQGTATADAPLLANQALVAGLSAAAKSVLATWQKQVSVWVRTPVSGAPAWQDNRQGYEFAVGARAPEGEVVLAAPDFDGRRLDWDAFEVSAGKSLGLTTATPVNRTVDVLPAPVRYPGMPASRWWEIEDGSIYFGGLAANPEDMARLVFAEFAITFGDDWYVLPVTLPVGSLSRITGLSVTDNFGSKVSVESIAARDHRLDRSRPFRLFELSCDPAAAAGRCPWLFLPAVGPDELRGAPVEEVLFLRDEMANMGWGIERRVESASGEPVARRTPSESATPDGWSFDVAPAVPRGFIPFLPVAAGTGLALRRARFAGWTDDDLPRARVLAPSRALTVREHDWPSTGMLVTRRWHRARGADGCVYLWMGRQRLAGNGEQSSGMVFDRLSGVERAQP